MNTVYESARELPVAADVEVCVVGGSCTGVFAAVRAARLGARPGEVAGARVNGCNAVESESLTAAEMEGRLVDADRAAYGAIRVMINANQTGEAAGVACALAIREAVDPVDVDPALLRRTLCDGGSLRPGENR